MPKRYEFFATRDDVLALLDEAELARRIQYVRAGLRDSEKPLVARSARDIENLGIATCGDQNLEPIFLILNDGVPVQVETVPQRRGGIKYAIDQSNNPRSVSIKTGGEYRDEALIAGQIGTVSQDRNSMSLLRLFGKLVRRRFERVRGYYLSEGAARALDSGLRLTACITAPTTCDLKRKEMQNPHHASGSSRAKGERHDYDESFRIAQEALGLEGEPIEDVTKRPAHNDEQLGPSLFRTGAGDAQVQNLTLPGLFVGRSELRDLRMTNCDLRLSTFCWNDFTGCVFDRSILRAADFRDSNYLRCSFVDTDLREADFRRTFFEQCDFTGADLTGAIATPDFTDLVSLTETQHQQIQWADDPGPKAPGG